MAFFQFGGEAQYSYGGGMVGDRGPMMPSNIGPSGKNTYFVAGWYESRKTLTLWLVGMKARQYKLISKTIALFCLCIITV